MICIYTFFGILIIAVPVLIESKQRLFVTGIFVAVLFGAFVFSQFLRFKITLSAAGVELQRTWAGIRYARLLVKLDSTNFEVWGTGDWGDDGSWPIRAFCELSPNGQKREDLTIGTPRMANTIAQFLNAHKTRLLQGERAVA